MTYEPMKHEEAEEVESPQSWWMIVTHPAIIVALLAIVSFFALVTAQWKYMPPR